MTNPRVFLKWSAIGFAVGVFLVITQAIAVDGLAGLLQVGEQSALRDPIEAQLGPVPLAEGPGHDGQIFYAMGVDLSGDEVGPLLDHAAYRYRRILYPLVASAFGLLDGRPLLYGMVAVAVISMAVSAGMVASMAKRAGKSELLALAIVLNPGSWLSVRLLTSDVLALSLMLVGLYAFTSDRGHKSGSAFTLSGLAKDVSLVTAVALGGRSRNWRVLVVPISVLALWMGYLSIRLGGGFSSRGNLDWPLIGLLKAARNWLSFDVTDWVYLVFAIASVVAGVMFSLRKSWLRWPIVAWTALAIISSDWVWDFGNNAARAFAPIVVLVALTGIYASTDDIASDSRSVAKPTR